MSSLQDHLQTHCDGRYPYITHWGPLTIDNITELRALHGQSDLIGTL